jgi:hypothetical protein
MPGRLGTRLFGLRNAHCVFRRVVRGMAQPVHPSRPCTCVRDVLYKNDVRWRVMACDSEYMRVFPVKRGWWPPHLWHRVASSTDPRSDADDASSHARA